MPMSFDDIFEKDKAGKYDYALSEVELSILSHRPFKNTVIFDEDKSVRWNMEEVVRKNAEFAEKKQLLRDKVSDVERQFDKDLIEAIAEDIKFTFIKFNLYDSVWEAASKISSRAYDESHSDGRRAMAQKASDLCDFVISLF
jgi:hypothetical protein